MAEDKPDLSTVDQKPDLTSIVVQPDLTSLSGQPDLTSLGGQPDLTSVGLDQTECWSMQESGELGTTDQGLLCAEGMLDPNLKTPIDSPVPDQLEQSSRDIKIEEPAEVAPDQSFLEPLQPLVTVGLNGSPQIFVKPIEILPDSVQKEEGRHDRKSASSAKRQINFSRPHEQPKTEVLEKVVEETKEVSLGPENADCDQDTEGAVEGEDLYIPCWKKKNSDKVDSARRKLHEKLGELITKVERRVKQREQHRQRVELITAEHAAECQPQEDEEDKFDQFSEPSEEDSGSDSDWSSTTDESVKSHDSPSQEDVVSKFTSPPLPKPGPSTDTEDQFKVPFYGYGENQERCIIGYMKMSDQETESKPINIDRLVKITGACKETENMRKPKDNVCKQKDNVCEQTESAFEVKKEPENNNSLGKIELTAYSEIPENEGVCEVKNEAIDQKDPVTMIPVKQEIQGVSLMTESTELSNDSLVITQHKQEVNTGDELPNLTQYSHSPGRTNPSEATEDGEMPDLKPELSNAISLSGCDPDLEKFVIRGSPAKKKKSAFVSSELDAYLDKYGQNEDSGIMAEGCLEKLEVSKLETSVPKKDTEGEFEEIDGMPFFCYDSEEKLTSHHWPPPLGGGKKTRDVTHIKGWKRKFRGDMHGEGEEDSYVDNLSLCKKAKVVLKKVGVDDINRLGLHCGELGEEVEDSGNPLDRVEVYNKRRSNVKSVKLLAIEAEQPKQGKIYGRTGFGRFATKSNVLQSVKGLNQSEVKSSRVSARQKAVKRLKNSLADRKVLKQTQKRPKFVMPYLNEQWIKDALKALRVVGKNGELMELPEIPGKAKRSKEPRRIVNECVDLTQDGDDDGEALTSKYTRKGHTKSRRFHEGNHEMTEGTPWHRRRLLEDGIRQDDLEDAELNLTGLLDPVYEYDPDFFLPYPLPLPAPPPGAESPICDLDYCRLGCVCESLRQAQNKQVHRKRHCGNADCVLGCHCNYRYKIAKTHDMWDKHISVQDGLVELGDGLKRSRRLQHKTVEMWNMLGAAGDDSEEEQNENEEGEEEEDCLIEVEEVNTDEQSTCARTTVYKPLRRQPSNTNTAPRYTSPAQSPTPRQQPSAHQHDTRGGVHGSTVSMVGGSGGHKEGGQKSDDEDVTITGTEQRQPFRTQMILLQRKRNDQNDVPHLLEIKSNVNWDKARSAILGRISAMAEVQEYPCPCVLVVDDLYVAILPRPRHPARIPRHLQHLLKTETMFYISVRITGKDSSSSSSIDLTSPDSRDRQLATRQTVSTVTGQGKSTHKILTPADLSASRKTIRETSSVPSSVPASQGVTGMSGLSSLNISLAGMKKTGTGGFDFLDNSSSINPYIQSGVDSQSNKEAQGKKKKVLSSSTGRTRFRMEPRKSFADNEVIVLEDDSDPEDASNSQPKTKASLKHSELNSTQASEVSSIRSSKVKSPQPSEVKSPHPLEVKSPGPLEVKSAQPTEVKSPCPLEVKSSSSLKMKSPQPSEANSPPTTEVKSPRPSGVKSPKPSEVKLQQSFDTKSSQPSKVTPKFLVVNYNNSNPGQQGPTSIPLVIPNKSTSSSSTPLPITPKPQTSPKMSVLNIKLPKPISISKGMPTSQNAKTPTTVTASKIPPQNRINLPTTALRSLLINKVSSKQKVLFIPNRFQGPRAVQLRPVLIPGQHPLPVVRENRPPGATGNKAQNVSSALPIIDTKKKIVFVSTKDKQPLNQLIPLVVPKGVKLNFGATNTANNSNSTSTTKKAVAGRAESEINKKDSSEKSKSHPSPSSGEQTKNPELGSREKDVSDLREAKEEDLRLPSSSLLSQSVQSTGAGINEGGQGATQGGEAKEKSLSPEGKAASDRVSTRQVTNLSGKRKKVCLHPEREWDAWWMSWEDDIKSSSGWKKACENWWKTFNERKRACDRRRKSSESYDDAQLMLDMEQAYTEAKKIDQEEGIWEELTLQEWMKGLILDKKSMELCTSSETQALSQGKIPIPNWEILEKMSDEERKEEGGEEETEGCVVVNMKDMKIHWRNFNENKEKEIEGIDEEIRLSELHGKGGQPDEASEGRRQEQEVKQDTKDQTGCDKVVQGEDPHTTPRSNTEISGVKDNKEPVGNDGGNTASDSLPVQSYKSLLDVMGQNAVNKNSADDHCTVKKYDTNGVIINKEDSIQQASIIEKCLEIKEKTSINTERTTDHITVNLEAAAKQESIDREVVTEEKSGYKVLATEHVSCTSTGESLVHKVVSLTPVNNQSSPKQNVLDEEVPCDKSAVNKDSTQDPDPLDVSSETKSSGSSSCAEDSEYVDVTSENCISNMDGGIQPDTKDINIASKESLINVDGSMEQDSEDDILDISDSIQCDVTNIEEKKGADNSYNKERDDKEVVDSCKKEGDSDSYKVPTKKGGLSGAQIGMKSADELVENNRDGDKETKVLPIQFCKGRPRKGSHYTLIEKSQEEEDVEVTKPPSSLKNTHSAASALKQLLKEQSNGTKAVRDSTECSSFKKRKQGLQQRCPMSNDSSMVFTEELVVMKKTGASSKGKMSKRAYGQEQTVDNRSESSIRSHVRLDRKGAPYMVQKDGSIMPDVGNECHSKGAHVGEDKHKRKRGKKRQAKRAEVDPYIEMDDADSNGSRGSPESSKSSLTEESFGETTSGENKKRDLGLHNQRERARRQQMAEDFTTLWKVIASNERDLHAFHMGRISRVRVIDKAKEQIDELTQQSLVLKNMLNDELNKKTDLTVQLKCLKICNNVEGEQYHNKPEGEAANNSSFP